MNPTPDDVERQVDPADLATQLVEELVAALINARIFEVKHPRTRSSIAAVQRLLHELGELTREEVVRLGCVDDLIVFKKRPLLGASLAASRLIDLLRQWDAGGVELKPMVAATELEELLTAVVARPQPGVGHAEINALLQSRQCTGAGLLPPYTDPNLARRGGTQSGNRIHVAVRFYQAVVDLLQNITITVCRGGRIDFAPVQAHAEEVLHRLESDEVPLLGLARHEQYDAFTFGHSVRVAVLSLHFARALTDDRDLLIRIGTAALLHDVGKSLIPYDVLHSHKPLTAAEREEMNKHTTIGAELLLDHKEADPLAISSAFGHHRSPDGTGYPRTVHDYRMSAVTNLVKICDIYEALTAARPYKQPMSPIRAYRVMLAMGHKLDQRMLRRFIEINGVYPVGQLVALSTGEIAVVRQQGRHMMEPVVALLVDSEGNRLAAEDQQLIDLSDIECCGARAVLGELAADQDQLVREPDLAPS